MKKYFPQEIESYWQKVWKQEGIYKFSPTSRRASRGKYYNLVELPYPSGDLHLGHWFAFVPPDAHARYKRMSGFDVFFPNGFDAFGLPAENAAIKKGVHPKDWTMKNIDTMTKQFAAMGTMIDWDYTAITCLPEYYKWNQWIFLKMFEKGLAYRGKALSNWCPIDQTVLANEHIEQGKCWRCGSEVIQKEVEQWFLKITDYADRLIWPETGPVESFPPASARSRSTDMRAVGSLSTFATRSEPVDWPKQVRDGQNNWIGKSEGMLLRFEIKDPVVSRQSRFSDDARSSFPKNQSQTRSLSESRLSDSEDKQSRQEPSFGSPQSELSPSDINHKSYIEVFTTRPETCDGATFLVVSPEIAESLLNLSDVSDDARLSFPKSSKTPRSLSESRLQSSKNNQNGGGSSFSSSESGQDSTANLDEIKEYIKKAKKKTEMERKEDRTKSGIFSGVYVKNPVTDKDIPVWISDYVLAGYGTGAIMAVPSADERDREFAEKFQLPIEKTSFKAEPVGEKKVNYHLRDWSISRQRYWGTPVPIVYCENCAKNVKTGGQPRTVIDNEEYAMIAVPYKDLPVELPYNVDYTPKGKPPLASDEKWLNVKCPKCGGEAKRDAETLDTFFDSAWYFYRYVSPEYKEGPFDKLKVKKLLPVDVYFGGSEHTLGHTLYARFFTKVFKDFGLIDFDEFANKRVQHGVVLGSDGNRMSKSKGNVVSPDDVVKEYGADAVRLYLCFMMPYEATAPWSSGAINGIYRFLKRVWELSEKVSKDGKVSEVSNESQSMMHKSIKKVGDDLNNFQFNTAVSALMTWLNFLSAKDKISKEEYETFLKLLAPFAPHLTEEIWSRGARSGSARQSIHLEKWPQFDPKYLIEDEVSIVVQINGKLRDTIRVESSKLKVQSYVEEEAKKSDKVKKYLTGSVKKVIYIEGRLINFVTD